jgi:subtilisin family serine protease
MKKNIIIILCFLLSTSNAFSQQYLTDIIWFKVVDDNLLPIDSISSNNNELNFYLTKYNVNKFVEAFPFAKNRELKKIHELQFSGNIDSLIYDLQSNFQNRIINFSKHEISETRTVYEPTDWFWQCCSADWLWHLSKTQSNLAWDITKGSPNIKIALLDIGFDITHPDLVNKISPHYDPYNGSTNQFGCNPWNGHGTIVASFAGAETTEQGGSSNGDLASTGFKTMLVCYESPGTRQLFLQKALHASNVMGAKVITSCANGGLFCTPDLNSGEDLIVKEILDNGTSIIMPAGNGLDGWHCGTLNNYTPFYPLNPSYDERVIIIASSNIEDKHEYFLDTTDLTHSHFEQVDLCSPGYDIMGASPTGCGLNTWPYYGSNRGTSFATPIVSGIAGLMYDINPCLTPAIAQDILKNTTDPIIDAANFAGQVGTGRVNAFKAVQAAQGAYSPNLDLYMKDRPEDFGYAGSYAWGWWFDKSPDIWVRNQPDGLTNQIHQEPEYSSTQPVFVYVRIWNKSCDSSYAAGNLSLYWTKASTSSSWPQNWDGSQPNIGGQISSVSIPNLGPGESSIIEFQWDILNPYINQNWASCLLARIENIANDPITIYPNQLEYDVYHNNNVALRNVTVVDIQPGLALPNIGGKKYPHGRFIYIGNVHDSIERHDITFEIPKEIESNSLIEEAEITITTDTQGWDLLKNAITNNSGVKKLGENRFLIKNRKVVLENIEFPANTRIPIYVGFSFLIDRITSEETYYYTVSQKISSSDNHFTGAEHFEIRKSPRSTFNANAGLDKEIHKNDSTEILATEITELAIYNWYDPEGNLIQSEKNATVSPEITTKYKLEVIANTDGFKDYDEVTITVKNFWINQISPNPADNQTLVSFQIETASSAYLMVMNDFGTVFNNYILPLNSHSHNIDISNYVAGAYNVILVVNGIAVDAKNLIIN